MDSKHLKKIRYCLVSMVFWSMILVLLATLQKMLMGVPLILKGYILPSLFGIISGFVIGFLRYKEKTAIDQIKQNNKKFSNLAEGLTTGIAIIIEGKKYWINKGFANMFGYSKEELIGIDAGFLLHPDELPRVMPFMDKRLAGENIPAEYETIAIKKDGSQINVHVSAKLITFDHKQAIQLIVRDVTQHKIEKAELLKHREHLEELVQERTKDLVESAKAMMNLTEDVNESRRKLEEVNTQLIKANKELESFSYSVSHDLKVPLRALDGFSKTLQEDYANNIDEEGQEYIHLIRDNAKIMKELIDDLLEFSRLGRKKLIKTRVNLHDMFLDVIEDVKRDNKNRLIEFEIQDLKTVYADKKLLKPVITNLISNAVKFTKIQEKAKVQIGCTLYPESTEFFVKDNGVGFNMKYADKLFNVFQRLHTVDEFEGTGIGLALIKRIIDFHGGTVHAEGEVDKGACFYFSIPLEIINES
jgi:PAS domain S-box-containing protein